MYDVRGESFGFWSCDWEGERQTPFSQASAFHRRLSPIKKCSEIRKNPDPDPVQLCRSRSNPAWRVQPQNRAQQWKPAHVLLPPTLEEDHYPKGVQLARISYAIRPGTSLTPVATGARKYESRSFEIRIAPERHEEPPLGVYDDQHEYYLQRTLAVRSTFWRMLGELTAETSRPPCLNLDPQTPGSGAVDIKVKLTFIPAREEELPPEITTTIAKIREHTFFAAAPFGELPRPKKACAKMMLHKSYAEDFTISALKLNNVMWSKYPGSHSIMTNSITSASPPSSLIPVSTYFTTSLLVPVTIPGIQTSKRVKKHTPTFHSCLISRIHALELEIHVKTNSPIMLTVPSQLVS